MPESQSQRERLVAAARLAAFKVPTHVVFWTEPLPRTSTGKVVKRDLRQRVARDSDRTRKPAGPEPASGNGGAAPG